MVLAATLDVYEAAYLAGGLDRAVDTAAVVLVESGQVRVRSTGELAVVEHRPRHEIEAAVLDAIGSGGYRTIGDVRYHAGQDRRFAAVADRLAAAGLLRRRRLPGPWRRRLTPTAAGRRVRRQLRADPPDGAAALGTSAARVAVGGPDRMPDLQLRNAVFHQPRPPRRWPRQLGWGGWGGCGDGGGGCGGGGCGGGGCGGGGGG